MQHIRKMAVVIFIVLSTFIMVACNGTKSGTLTVTGSYKTNYIIHETFMDEGMIVTYSKGDEETIVTDYEVTGFNSSVVGTNTITIKYLDASVNIQLTILSGVQTTTE